MTSIKQSNGKMAIKPLLAQRDRCCQRSCAAIAGTVCVWMHKFVCWRALNNAQLFPPMTNSLHKGCSLSHCSKALTCRLSVTGTSLLTRRGVHNAIY